MPELTFKGEKFALAESFGLMAVMRFAKAAKADVDSDSAEGLVAMYDLLEHVLAPQDWERFVEHATATRASGDELNLLVGEALGVIAERPTERLSDSSDGPTRTGTRSAADSSSRVVQRLEAQGRPDLALMVAKTQESMAG